VEDSPTGFEAGCTAMPHLQNRRGGFGWSHQPT
jgi:hypothetical protein